MHVAESCLVFPSLLTPSQENDPKLQLCVVCVLRSHSAVCLNGASVGASQRQTSYFSCKTLTAVVVCKAAQACNKQGGGLKFRVHMPAFTAQHHRPPLVGKLNNAGSESCLCCDPLTVSGSSLLIYQKHLLPLSQPAAQAVNQN